MFSDQDLPSPRRLAPGVYMVGGPDLTDPRDCLCYLVTGPEARVLIDCGAGPSASRVLELAQSAGNGLPTHLLLTHAHIDHAGGAAEIRRLCGCKVLIHPGDADTMRRGDAERSAANWYGMRLEALEPDGLLEEGQEIALGESAVLTTVHTPGHTPGSVAAWCQAGGQRVLFGQDIHGPFSPAFGSDLAAWRDSMAKLLALEADILAEGHFGVFSPRSEVESYIRGQLGQH